MTDDDDYKLDEYDGTQYVSIHLLMPGGRLEELMAQVKKMGYITFFKAEDAPDAVVRFPSVGHAIRLKKRQEGLRVMTNEGWVTYRAVDDTMVEAKVQEDEVNIFLVDSTHGLKVQVIVPEHVIDRAYAKAEESDGSGSASKP